MRRKYTADTVDDAKKNINKDPKSHLHSMETGKLLNTAMTQEQLSFYIRINSWQEYHIVFSFSLQ